MIGLRLVEFYLAATVILLGALLVRSRCRQPALRRTVGMATVVGLWCLALLAAVPNWPRVGLVGRGAEAPSVAPPTFVPVLSQAEPAFTLTPQPVTQVRPAPALATAIPGRPFSWPSPTSLALGLFGSGSIVTLLWLSIGLHRTHRLRRGSRPAPEAMQTLLAQVVGPGYKLPDLRISPDLCQPVAMGLFRPAILLPDHPDNILTPTDLRAILAHEWAHIHHRDLVLIAATRTLLPLLYAHPAYWWLRRGLRDDQEFLADQAAATASPEARVAYAETLLTWAVGGSRTPTGLGGTLALGERPSQLKRRILMLLDPKLPIEPTTTPARQILLLASMTTAALGLASLTLQPNPATAAAPLALPPLQIAAPQFPPQTAVPQLPSQAVATQPPTTAIAATPAAESAAAPFRVLDLAGKPIAGAKVYQSNQFLPPDKRNSQNAVLLATTDTMGTFLAHPSNHPRFPNFVVLAPGYGPGWFVEGRELPVPSEYRLVTDDVPIVGQLLNSSQKPVAGVNVRVIGLAAETHGSLDDWLAMLAKEKAASPAENLLSTLRDDAILALLPSVISDRDGRFTIHGIGRDRVVTLLIQGSGIETRVEQVVTRSMAQVSVPERPRQRLTSTITYHPSQFQIVADVGMNVDGTVTDAATGLPLGGALVRLSSAFPGATQYIRTTTDDSGHYRLVSIPRKGPFGNEQEILVVGNTEGPAYVSAARKLGDPPVGEPIRQNFAMKRGVWVTGRVLDKTTGQHRVASYDYFLLDDNRHFEEFPEYGSIRVGMGANQTDQQGRYRISVLPGAGLLAARVSFGGYRKAAGLESLQGVKAEPEGSMFAGSIATKTKLFRPDHYESIIAIDPKPGEETIHRDIFLENVEVSGIRVTVIDPEARPTAGAMMMTFDSGSSTWCIPPMTSAIVQAPPLTAGQPRGYVFIHKERKLAGAGVIKTDTKESLSIMLHPHGEATGCIVNAQGKPVAGAVLQLGLPSIKDGKCHEGWLPEPIRTDGAGRFQITGMVPGLIYRFKVWEDSTLLGFFEFVPKPGETRDLGDVKPAL